MCEILIVDDEADVRNFLKEELISENFSVTTVSNGADAIVTAVEKSFDLIILDMLMPGLDGIQVIRVLKKVVPNISIIGLTGYVARGYISQATSYGVTCLKKPIVIADLLKEINLVLNRKVS